MGDSLQRAVETTVEPMGYELVEFERLARGLLRVTIDRPEGIRIEDCERVSRQLTQVFTVENIDFGRLEVSSAGVDRPLKKLADYVRFAGQNVIVKLRMPARIDNGNRKTFEGILQAPVGDGPDAQLGLVFKDKAGVEQVLGFILSEVDHAHLKLTLDYRKGKK
jgi:ribosome maturation factor RimP